MTNSFSANFRPGVKLFSVDFYCFLNVFASLLAWDLWFHEGRYLAIIECPEAEGVIHLGLQPRWITSFEICFKSGCL